MNTKYPFGFRPESPLDFSQPQVREKVAENIQIMRRRFGKRYPLLINGKEIWTPPEKMYARKNPSNTSEIVGYVSMANISHAQEALDSARRGQVKWGEMSQSKRSAVLYNAAQILGRERFFFLALMALEVGKERVNADGEIVEAIDFFNYYGKAAEWLSTLVRETLVQVPGEENDLWLPPAGVVVSIQPWNFPLSLSAGTIAAALAMGNAVVYKPATTSAIVGYHLVKVLHEAGVPTNVLHYVPGSGRTVGSHLIEHSLRNGELTPSRAGESDLVCFTGSETIGNELEYLVAQYNHDVLPHLPPGNRMPKMKPVVEKGGNGFLIVDEGADGDAAVKDVITSAFGYQGQKCSAGRRVILVGRMYDQLIPRIIKCVQDFKIGPPEDSQYQVGPAIDEEAYKRLLEFSKLCEEKATILARGNVPEDLKIRGYFVPPLLVGDVPPDSEIAQEESFGPILVAFRAKDLDEAIALANSTAYGLTGSVFSRNPAHIEKAKRALQVGNLYINRKTTGAEVGRHPFGGMKMSGDSQSKAGTWDYLLQFCRRKTICENTERRGHAPSS